MLGRFNIKIRPLTQRRWDYFKRNRRGYYSLWVFLSVLVITLMAELVSCDQPLVVYYERKLYFPVICTYPETTFGGDFETNTDYRDPYIQKRLSEKGWVLWPFFRYGYDTVNYELDVPAPSPPTWENPLGTDDQGRDVLARLIYGCRLSLLFGLLLTLMSAGIGVLAGGIQGYFGGKIDLLFQRFIEIWSGIPTLYLLIILSSFAEPRFWSLLGLMILFGWMSLTALVRAEFLRARNFDYVRAAQALGVSTPKIMFRHILPNAMVATLTYLPFILNGAITTLTSLDFLGFGLPPGSPSLGEMLSQGKNNLHAPWLGLASLVSVGGILALLIFIGEGVRDAFDPRKIDR